MKYQQIATNAISAAAIIALIYLVLWLSIAARAQDDPICVPDQPCVGPAVTAVATPTATPVIAPSPEATPEATPVIIRPFPLSPCKLAPGCALLPIAVTP